MRTHDPKPQKKPKAPIDWREIERRMEAMRAAIEHAWAPTPEEAKRILKARAQALAREPEPAETAGERIDVVEFVLAHERYAVESRHVREVAPLENLTPLPCTPAFVLGIVNLRGEILSVIEEVGVERPCDPFMPGEAIKLDAAMLVLRPEKIAAVLTNLANNGHAQWRHS